MRQVIGIIGPLASGKDSAAKCLQKRPNTPIYQISSELKELAEQNEIPTDRENLINYSRELVSIYGDDYLARRIFEKNNDELMIVVGMRQVGQINYLRDNPSLTLIGIDASPEIRFERVKDRNKIGDPFTLEHFLEIERKENGKSVQKISDCMKQVDHLIENEGYKRDLCLKIKRMIL